MNTPPTNPTNPTTSTKKSVSAVVSEDVSEGIERLARRRRVSVSELIRQLLEQAIQDERQRAEGRAKGGGGVAYLLAERAVDPRVEHALRGVRAAFDRRCGPDALVRVHAYLDTILHAESVSPRLYSRVEATIAARSLPWRVGTSTSSREHCA